MMLISVSQEQYLALSREIESVRERMVQLGGELGLMHPEVHLCSQQLDVLLLRYYEIDKIRRSGGQGTKSLEVSASKEYTLC
ncbi:aspartyl-phosphate phosphatase Spo0E family protein [Paenibacillus validus]|uniref:aspartyl-phosphate phosphatase Spo0E family protein n=1 Tax=Paenibacillus TaxID=44249 RepID=UPI001FD5DCE2|nr:aspartyl-phosphate phosphatase Spo0E family protein [Paenibacillus validus]MED4603022.1 aspartyl-phosphate phosphatase Spo0E family protein [Paenibacillus validus]MED4607526.1 aspartyl-phosphate phosphatase Spo0E family protein [Paenibacillus validus]